jgi:hypothetical protein
MSGASRDTILAFSKEHARFRPFFDAVWEPKALAPESARFLWRKVFWL